MIRWFYSALLYLTLPLVWLRLIHRGMAQPGYRQYRKERWGYYHPVSGTAPLIWIHAVSVGETRAAEPLIGALLSAYPQHNILLTSMTPTGRATGAERFVENPSFGARFPHRVRQAYLPYDYPDAVARFLKHFQPQIGLLMETELWPNLMSACARHQLPILLVNARLSERSARGYARFSALTGAAFRQLRGVIAQTAADAERLSTLGATVLGVSGNLKFDVQPDKALLDQGKTWRASFGERPVWLAASTREGEENGLLAAHQTLLKEVPDALLMLVPRHPQRFQAIADQVIAAGLSMVRRSESQPLQDTQVWLGDSMGEMPAYYACADIAVMGGSWMPLGGQNLIEATACACPVLVGPHTFNFAQATEDAIAAGAACRLPDTEALPGTLLSLWSNPANQLAMQNAAAQFTAQHQGATQRTLEHIRHLFPVLPHAFPLGR